MLNLDIIGHIHTGIQQTLMTKLHSNEKSTFNFNRKFIKGTKLTTYFIPKLNKYKTTNFYMIWLKKGIH